MSARTFVAGVGVAIGVATLYALRSRQRKCKTAEQNLTALTQYDAVVFDLDGVVWEGHIIIPGAIDALNTLIEKGRKVFFFTNNAGASRQEYAQKLQKIGVHASESNIYTSAFCAALYLQTHNYGKNDKVYVIGAPALFDELEAAGLTCLGHDDHTITNIPLIDISSRITVDPNIRAVVMGFDYRFNLYKLSYASLSLQQPNVLFVATNPDKQFPSNGKIMPGNGSFLSAVQTGSGGRAPDVVCGKPNPTGLQMILDTFSIPKNKLLMVGDRLDTDILFGIGCGVDTMLVLSGCTTASEAHAASRNHQPTFIANSIDVFNQAFRESK